MNCPNCKSPLRSIQYEGVEIETCQACGGEWLDARELGKIVRIREVKFDESERRAIAESTTVKGVPLKGLDRDLPCPKCHGTTDPVNYGGDSGLIVDRCTGCGGFWLDGSELEKVQILVESWDDALPGDLKKYGPRLRDVAARIDKANDVQVSRLPLIGGFINSLVNGILDLAD